MQMMVMTRTSGVTNLGPGQSRHVDYVDKEYVCIWSELWSISTKFWYHYKEDDEFNPQAKYLVHILGIYSQMSV